MIDFSKTPEEIKEELILSLMHLKQYDKGVHELWSGMSSKMAKECAIIMVKGMIQVCPKEIHTYFDPIKQSIASYDSQEYIKLVQVLELLENEK